VTLDRSRDYKKARGDPFLFLGNTRGSGAFNRPTSFIDLRKSASGLRRNKARRWNAPPRRRNYASEPRNNDGEDHEGETRTKRAAEGVGLPFTKIGKCEGRAGCRRKHLASSRDARALRDSEVTRENRDAEGTLF